MILDSSIKRILKPDLPPWLTMLQNDLALITHQDAQKHWGNPALNGAPYYNSRLEHVQQVERDVLRLADGVHADQDILLAAVWIHDRFPPRYEGDQHPARAASWTRAHLASKGFPAEKVDKVAFAIEHHADPPGTIPENNPEARLLWDANKLAKMGSLHIVSYLCSHPAFPDQRITYTNMALLGLEKLERARRTVECLYFDHARQIASDRYNQQKMFYEALARDVNA